MALVQLILEWRRTEWAVIRSGVQHGAFVSEADARALAAALAEDIQRGGDDCELLVHDRDGRWRDEPCPETPVV